MSELSTVPGWVRPPSRAVARMEDFLLRLRGRTQAAETLGAWAGLYWLVAPEGGRDRGPLTRRALPTEDMVRGEFRVADAIAEGEPYPGSAWWVQRGIPAAERMPVSEWDVRIGNPYERFYCHGVRVALGWVLGIIDDPALLAPIRDGNGALIPPADRDAYAEYLREIARPTARADEYDRAISAG
jgi:hypothetical protein